MVFDFALEIERVPKGVVGNIPVHHLRVGTSLYYGVHSKVFILTLPHGSIAFYYTRGSWISLGKRL